MPESPTYTRSLPATESARAPAYFGGAPLPKNDHRIARLVARAEECRVLASIVIGESSTASYLQLAANYESLAEEERRLLALAAACTAEIQAAE